MAYFFAHLVLAALRAIAARLEAVRDLALAAPPLRPPKRPSATAAGFLPFSEGADSWVASATMRKAAELASDCLLERLGITPKLALDIGK